MKNISPKKSQSGNVLFIIFLAIALFSALTYAVTQSSQGSGDMDREEAILQGSNFLESILSIRAKIQRNIMVNDCNLANISSDKLQGGNATWADDHTGAHQNPCNIWSDTGAGLQAPLAGLDSFLIDQSDIPSAMYNNLNVVAFFNENNVWEVGSNVPDDILLVRFLQRDVCIGINTALGISTADGQPPSNTTTDFGAWLAPRPSAEETDHSTVIGRTASGFNELVGHKMGCYQGLLDGTGAVTYVFYLVFNEY